MNRTNLTVLGIDPGKAIGACAFDGEHVRPKAVAEFNALWDLLFEFCRWANNREERQAVVAIEGIVPYASQLSMDVIETCYQIGSILRACELLELPTLLISRREIKSHLLGRATGADADVRRALVDALGESGTKKNPGATYGVTGHTWSALAVAYVSHCQLQGDKGNAKKFAAGLPIRGVGA